MFFVVILLFSHSAEAAAVLVPPWGAECVPRPSPAPNCVRCLEQDSQAGVTDEGCHLPTCGSRRWGRASAQGQLSVHRAKNLNPNYGNDLQPGRAVQQNAKYPRVASWSHLLPLFSKVEGGCTKR